MKTLVLILSFLAGFFIALAIWLFIHRRVVVRRLLETYALGKPAKEQQTPSEGRKTLPWVGSILKALAKRTGLSQRFEKQIERAGLSLDVRKFLLIAIVFSLFLGLIGLLLTRAIIIALVLFVSGLAASDQFLKYLGSRRTKLFLTQLPDILTLAAGSFRAGATFISAISTIAEESLPPASIEFQRVLSEIRLGFTLEESLEKMSERIGLKELQWLVLTVKVQREVGGSFAEIMDTLARNIRESAALRRHVSALAAEGKLSAIILTVLPFGQALLLYLINPEYMSLLFAQRVGWVMIGGALFLLGVGILWLRKIVTIEV
jgi:tight adherence protein B